MEKVLLRKVQLVQLEIAKEFKRVCDENNIKYFMDSGTLLGAVRHKGFIPWDDDMDFGMIREDYDRFIEIAPEKLSSEFFLQSWESDPNYPYAFAKIRKKNTLFVEALFQKSQAHNELYIDIFPYDIYPEKDESRLKQGRKIMRYKNALLIINKAYPWMRHSGFVKRFLVICKYLPSIIYAMFNKREDIIKKYNVEMRRHNTESSKYLYEQAGGAVYGKWVIPKRCLDEYTLLDFETEKFSAPIDSDAYLKATYGDYMKLPPEDKRENRHAVLEIKL